MWVWRIMAAACFSKLWRACLRERHQKERGTKSTRERETPEGEGREERGERIDLEGDKHEKEREK